MKKNKTGGFGRYLGIDLIVSMNKTIYHTLLRPIYDFKNIRKNKPRDFEEVIRENNLSDLDLKKKSQYFLFYSSIALIIGLFLFMYYCININSFTFLTSVNYIIIVLLFFIVSFRYYYFRYLIHKRKLGVPVIEFFKDIIRGNI